MSHQNVGVPEKLDSLIEGLNTIDNSVNANVLPTGVVIFNAQEVAAEEVVTSSAIQIDEQNSSFIIAFCNKPMTLSIEIGDGTEWMTIGSYDVGNSAAIQLESPIEYIRFTVANRSTEVNTVTLKMRNVRGV